MVSGLAVEHALTRSVRDSAALLDATAGPDLGDPYWAPPPPRPFTDEVGRDPGRLRIAFSSRPAGDAPAHPDCVAALEDAAQLCASLGHELEEAEVPPLTPDVEQAISTVVDAATAWILGYWVRRLGREPAAGEIEPYTRVRWEAGRRVSAAAYLLAIDRLRAYSRDLERFLTRFDAWLTPTLAEPPPPLGELTSTPEDPWRPVTRMRRFVAFPAVLANISGGAAMSVPLHRNGAGLPIGVHFLGRFGGEGTLLRLAAQLEAARPWAGPPRVRQNS